MTKRKTIEEFIFDAKKMHGDKYDYSLVEYNGEQHFKSIKYWGGKNAYEKQQNNDEIKNKFAKENNIKLLRIKYNKINKILEEMI